MKRSVSILSVMLVMMLVLPLAGRGQWVQTNGPWGVDFEPLALHAFASIDTTLFVATSEGVFASTDTGLTWSDRSKGLPNLPFKALDTMGTILFAAGDSNIFISHDEGMSWAKTNWEFGRIGCIYVRDSTIYAAGDSLYRSGDSGITWTASGLPYSEYGPFGLLFCGSNLLVATDYGLDISTDSGHSWKLSDSGMVGTNGGNADHLFLSGSVLYVEIGGVIGSMDVFRSTDYGVSWERTPLRYPLIGTDIEGGFAALGDIVFAGSCYDNQVYSSSDQGISWTIHPEALGGIQALASFGGKLFVAKVYNNETGSSVSGFGVYRSDDSAKTWKFSSVGIPETQVYSLASNGGTLYAGIDGGIRSTFDEGDSWNDLNFLGDRTISHIAAYGSDIVMIVDFDSILAYETAYYSVDSGKTFKRSVGLPTDYLYCLANIDSTFFVGTDYGLYISHDRGKSWSRIAISEPAFFPSLAVLGQNLFACTYDIRGVPIGIMKSANYGSTWEGSDTGYIGKYVEEISSAGKLLFGDAYLHGIIRSTDSGLSWSSLAVNDSASIGAIVPTGSFLIASIGTPESANISVSNDSGLTWNSVSDGLGIDSMSITSLCVHDNFIFAGTWNDGVWRRPLSDFGISSVSQQQPTHLETISAYPNPATQSTSLHFTTPGSGYATITVVNTLGAEVARIYSGEILPGEHSMVWNVPVGLAEGPYECIVRMHGDVQEVPVVVK